MRPCGLVLSAVLALGAASPRPAPLRIAVYYGYPSLVNGARGDLRQVVSHFSTYDVVIVGDGLEFDVTRPGAAGPNEHMFTARLIDQLQDTARSTAVFGYVDLGSTQRLPLAEVVDRIERWHRMGAHGVFFDEAGFDFGVSRARQNAAVSAAHARGLRVCLNAFRPDDLFGDDAIPLNAAGGGNPGGLHAVLSGRDAVLLESFGVKDGRPEPADAVDRRMRAALAGRRRFKTALFAVATGGTQPRDHALAAYGWWVASVFGLDAYGWGTPHYGAAASELPWIPRPSAESTLGRAQSIGDSRAEGAGWSRRTSLGVIRVDARALAGTLASD